MTKLLKFESPFCQPCKRLDIFLNQVDLSSVEFSKVDVTESPDIAAQYGIMSVPVLVLERDGEELGRLVGLVVPDAITEFIAKGGDFSR